ncbi:Alpha/Beta hydrolase protein [Parasitella parasitica]|nr:Alpha/Beta hydrolase protein [Parasitella parasitica]
MKRSFHAGFPDYSLRYTHPDLCDTGTKQTSGYFELPDGKNFFFWFFESKTNPSSDPTLLWINGGPGCSSMMGLFMGIGPCHVNKEGDRALPNLQSWNSVSNVIYLDQPVNSGYSYHENSSAYITDSNTAARDVYVFLQLFFNEFSHLSESDFHIAGESYAGHFLPAIATAINEKDKEESTTPIQLKSLIIGNGLTDPLQQYKYYKSMACEKSAYGTLISSSEKCNEMEMHQKECQKLIESCYNSSNVSSLFTLEPNEACVVASQACNALVVKPVIDATGLNTYDIRKQCEGGPLCYDYFDAIKTYLDNSRVKSALGVKPSVKFELCSNAVNANFQTSGDWMRPYVNQITPLLNSNISVLAYAGDADFMCNWMGIRAWTINLPWDGHVDYNKQNDINWYSNGTAAGTIRSSGPLTFLRLFHAGHMAPYDQPQVTLDMFSRWISGKIMQN